MPQPTERSFAPITDEHLARLSVLALEDREQFYESQPRYRGRHIATALAQGRDPTDDLGELLGA